MSEKKEYSIEEWSKTKPAHLELNELQVAAVYAAYEPVAALLTELGTTGVFYFMSEQQPTGSGILEGVVNMLSPDLVCAEMLVGHMLATGGMDSLVDNLEGLIDCMEERTEVIRKLTVVK